MVIVWRCPPNIFAPFSEPPHQKRLLSQQFRGCGEWNIYVAQHTSSHIHVHTQADPHSVRIIALVKPRRSTAITVLGSFFLFASCSFGTCFGGERADDDTTRLWHCGEILGTERKTTDRVDLPRRAFPDSAQWSGKGRYNERIARVISVKEEYILLCAVNRLREDATLVDIICLVVHEGYIKMWAGCIFLRWMIVSAHGSRWFELRSSWVSLSSEKTYGFLYSSLKWNIS